MSDYPETAKQALDAWDRGEIVWTVEMGGLGPGYEQAIQILLFEIIRATHENFGREAIPAFQAIVDEVVQRIHRSCGGFTGAQVGAASTLAFHVLRDGWRSVLDEVKTSQGQDRLTMVSRVFPHLETTP